FAAANGRHPHLSDRARGRGDGGRRRWGRRLRRLRLGGCGRPSPLGLGCDDLDFRQGRSRGGGGGSVSRRRRVWCCCGRRGGLLFWRDDFKLRQGGGGGGGGVGGPWRGGGAGAGGPAAHGAA